MRIDPQEITLDANERRVIRNALDALIHEKEGRIRRLNRGHVKNKAEKIEDAEMTIAETQDLNFRFIQPWFKP
jgi:hypothetical protein